MANPITIKIDGSVSGPGSAGVSRDDLQLAEVWTFTDPANGAGTYTWELIARPVGSSATLSGAATPTATMTPDIKGTYLVKLTFDDGTEVKSGVEDTLAGEDVFVSTQGGAAVKLTDGTRIPAAGETLQYGTEGWHDARDEHMRRVGAQLPSADQKTDLGVLDGAAQGTVWYANASGRVTSLAPGTAGRVLSTQGGGADPQWVDGATVSSTAPVDVTKAAAAAGSATEASRQDHKHDISTAAPSDIGTSNVEGTATSLARSDHVHRGQTRQSIFQKQTADISTTSTSFVTLMTQAITTVEKLFALFTACVLNTGTNTNVTIRMRVDGTVVSGSEVRVGTASTRGCVSMMYKDAIAVASARTVLIEWKVSGGTAWIRPTSNPDEEHATLLAKEVKF